MHTAFGTTLRTLVFLIGCAVASPAQDDADARLGHWQALDGSRTLLLERGRAGWLVEGKPGFYRVKEGDDGKLTFESWGRLTEYDMALADERLHVTGGGLDLEFERIEGLPAELLVEPYELPEGVDVDAERVAAVAAELAERRDEDQRVRSQGRDGDMSEMGRIDADNTEYIGDLIGELGWIDATRFGVAASDAAFLIVQHTADLRLMRTALPHIEADVRAGRLDGQNYTLMFDRLQLNLGYKQRYGSQIGIVDGERVLMPCEDIERVDEFRAEMGMIPLEQYLDFFREEGGPPPRHLGS